MPTNPRLVWLAVFVWTCGLAATRAYGVWPTALIAAILVGLPLLPAQLRHLRPDPANMMLGLSAGGASVFATYVLYPLFPVAGEVSRLYGVLGAVEGFAVIGFLVIVVAEELVFRGALHEVLGHRYWLSPFIFVIGHAFLGSPLLVAVAFLCGAFWTFLRRWSGSLLAPVVAHLVWDAAVFWLRPLASR